MYTVDTMDQIPERIEEEDENNREENEDSKGSDNVNSAINTNDQSEGENNLLK